VVSVSRRGATQGPKAEINVTPLVDVVLVLLLVFMVVTPLLASGEEVALPDAHGRAAAEPSRPAPVVITLSVDRRLWLGHEQLAHGNLRVRLGAVLASQPDAEVLVKADRRLSVADLRPLLAELDRAGARRIAFALSESRERAPGGGG